MIKVNGKFFRVKVLIPAGRRRYCKILSRYIEREMDLHKAIDSCTWMFNTDDRDDEAWIMSEVERRPDIYSPHWIEGCSGKIGDQRGLGIARHIDEIGRDPDAVYVRIDDDMLYFSDGTILNLAYAAASNSYLLTLPFVVNMGRMNKMMHEAGFIRECVVDEVIDVFQKEPQLSYFLHDRFLKGIFDVEKLKKMPAQEYGDLNGVNVGFVAWRGRDLTSLSESLAGKMMEEHELSVNWIERTGGSHFVDPSLGVASHFAYWRQRNFLDSTNTLFRYENLCDREMEKRK